jgi:hypothetical protein
MGRNYWLMVFHQNAKNNCFRRISFFQIPVSFGSRDFLFHKYPPLITY